MPSDKLELHYSRRQFMRFWIDRGRAEIGRQDGRPAYRIDELSSLPDDRLRRIVPAVAPDAQIDVEGDMAYLRLGAEPRLPLFPVDSPRATVFNLFDGDTSLAAAAAKLARSDGRSLEQAFAEVRAVFLYLAARRACLPGTDARPF
jgi:hypothetical protein